MECNDGWSYVKQIGLALMTLMNGCSRKGGRRMGHNIIKIPYSRKVKISGNWYTIRPKDQLNTESEIPLFMI